MARSDKHNPIPIVEAKERLDYNPETGVFVWRERDVKGFKRSLVGQEAGCVRTDETGYSVRWVGLQVGGILKLYAASRLAWAVGNGPIPQGMEVDHINGNSLDNRIANLRLVTSAANKRNFSLRKDNKSGYPGVKLSKSGKYVARAGACGRVWLGAHDTFEAAVAAKREWERQNGFHENHGRAA